MVRIAIDYGRFCLAIWKTDKARYAWVLVSNEWILSSKHNDHDKK